jgi:hypothetical protein
MDAPVRIPLEPCWALHTYRDASNDDEQGKLTHQSQIETQQGQEEHHQLSSVTHVSKAGGTTEEKVKGTPGHGLCIRTNRSGGLHGTSLGGPLDDGRRMSREDFDINTALRGFSVAGALNGVNIRVVNLTEVYKYKVLKFPFYRMSSPGFISPVRYWANFEDRGLDVTFSEL